MNSKQHFSSSLVLLGIFLLIIVGVYTDVNRILSKITSTLVLSKASLTQSISVDINLENGGGEIDEPDNSEPLVISYLAPPPTILPARDWSVQIPEITAQSYFVLDGQTNTILLNKGENEKRPVASLTKLVTAFIALKYIPPSAPILVSAEAAATEGKAGDLFAGESLSFYDALAALLLPSSNDAAEALAGYMGRDKFISLMNEEVKNMGINDASFKNPSGLDETGQYATAKGIINIFRSDLNIETLKNLLSKSIYETRSLDGKIYHRFVTSNWLLGSFPGVVAGKTGFTDEAGQSLVVAWRPPESSAIERKESLPVVYAVILGSQDRFGDMRAILEWLSKAYHW
ncbi:MAG: hypothetical protein A3A80_04475 [Candidatus Terrybacteria bacterium RIFCSPLOWO2_01_FULL_44_24]|uniref:Peptidase S11 D-alanyl-D-alanine carboxypeptidase A N-terminal domain-containing protein n=1 Tax=Candidatus Terrybacteria bacterium RIFCSPHIGHO2_01_FULL_43_35 TaxID=1802361 RepID=A0A1G2PDT6_9BACT|nr:MAG: hypothetical protein A2828_01350 [Candidatus Terrybacteria bacterium RIFCSPHIGHO2_01_FULL_43_35]OHA49675.1 MAG: hypothetical protein A3B75_01130 [Candidatus Terrybacteria bacterium RIFCSPHIGHO2_02_FULL_43_14]OHA51340.1 MAG: hypothetical protein A3A80_04475 [Candidatus Terrybacteria bacterium RIFCSPLOWO2_01_FULL_44_24]